MKVILYSTLGCHLCEQAKQVLWPLLTQYQYRLVEIDISEEDELIQRYGERIPVLAAKGVAQELNWPFTHADADAFFEKLIGM